MRAHAVTTKSARSLAFEHMRQEIQGKLPKGPFEFDAAQLAPVDADSSLVARFKKAVLRDAAYGAASAPFIRLMGMSHALRSTYEGGKQLLDGGGA